MKIDAHQHFWRVERAVDYPWMSAADTVLFRDHGPEDLAPWLARHGIDGTVLVQASPTLSETHALLDIAHATPFVQGVVGWCDLEDPEAVQVIATLARDPMLRGLRPMVHDIADPDWLLREHLGPALDAMVDQGLVFDALIRPLHLRRLDVLAQRHPGLSIVIDHAAKPAIGSGTLDDWRRDIALLAKRPGIACKLSGLVTECAGAWSVDLLRPVVDHLLQCFGPARLIWGSDWPVLNLAADYGGWLDAAMDLLSSSSSAERDAVFGGNASRVYFATN